jgi:extracellular factor (EF) 3-hydroxypalmitic acid methyl ester biosynthesis protein
MDFSAETLNYTKSKLEQAAEESSNVVNVKYIQESVHDLLKRNSRTAGIGNDTYDFIYCAGLFDYLSDKVCTRLIRYFLSKGKIGTKLLLTNVHASNPERHGMEHLLEWHLIYRDEAQMSKIMSEVDAAVHLFTDETGVNVFAEATLRSTPNGEGVPE